MVFFILIDIFFGKIWFNGNFVIINCLGLFVLKIFIRLDKFFFNINVLGRNWLVLIVWFFILIDEFVNGREIFFELFNGNNFLGSDLLLGNFVFFLEKLFFSLFKKRLFFIMILLGIYGFFWEIWFWWFIVFNLWLILLSNFVLVWDLFVLVRRIVLLIVLFLILIRLLL